MELRSAELQRSVPAKGDIHEVCRRQRTRVLVKMLAELPTTVPVPGAASQRARSASDTPELAAADAAVLDRWCQAYGLELYAGRPGEDLDCRVTHAVSSELWWELLLAVAPEAAIFARLLADLRGGREVEAIAAGQAEAMLVVRRALYAVAATFACERGEKVPLLQGALLGAKG